MSKLSHTSNKHETTLRRLRKARGLTQAALASRTGLSENAIAKLDRGEAEPRRASAILLGQALCCKPSDLKGRQD